jgi:hypothetical protein
MDWQQYIITTAISVTTSLVAWFARGKFEKNKVKLEIEKMSTSLREEEIQFRDRLLIQVLELQKANHELSQKHYEMGEKLIEMEKEIHSLRVLLLEKEEIIKNLKTKES